MFHISQAYEGALLSINFLQTMGDHGCMNLNPVHLSDTYGIFLIITYVTHEHGRRNVGMTYSRI